MTILASEPLAATITERPSGITSGGGRLPAAARVKHPLKAPGRVVADQVRVSTPSALKARAWYSACSTTPPQNDQE